MRIRYYATFKVKKLGLCSTKLIYVCKKLTNTCIGLRAEKIFSVNIYIYISILGVVFTFPFLCYLQKLQLLVAEKF